MEGVVAGDRVVGRQPFRERLVRLFAVGEIGVLAALILIVLFFYLLEPASDGASKWTDRPSASGEENTLARAEPLATPSSASSSLRSEAVAATKGAMSSNWTVSPIR